MKFAKRIVLFVAVNILIVATLSFLTSLFGVQPSLGGSQLNIADLAGFCLIYGFGAALISLALSRVMAKWMMGVRIIHPHKPASHQEQDLLERVHAFSRQAGLTAMPEVGIYDSPELNAFATGPTKNRALVAVSTGLLSSMDRNAIDGVLAHEVAHIANGDMVTMTLIQGVVNAFVMFLARMIAWFASQFVDEEKRSLLRFGIVIALEILLGFLGMMVVGYFSRQREFRADAGGANLAGTANMVSALKALKRAYYSVYSTGEHANEDGRSPALASLKISGKSGGFLKLLSTHPDLDERIDRLQGVSRA